MAWVPITTGRRASSSPDSSAVMTSSGPPDRVVSSVALDGLDQRHVADHGVHDERRLAAQAGATEAGHLEESRRSLDGLVHPLGARRTAGEAVQVATHDDVPDPGARERVGERATAAPVLDPFLQPVEVADGLPRNQGHLAARHPRAPADALDRLVDGPSPVLLAEAGAGEHQGAPPVRVITEPVRGLHPVLRDLAPALLAQVVGERGLGRGHQQHDERSGRDREGATRRECTHPGPEHRRETHAEVREPQRQGQPDEGVDLVHVAEHRERAVQQVPHHPGQRARQEAHVRHRQQTHPEHGAECQRGPQRHRRMEEAEQARRRDHPGHGDQPGIPGEVVGAGPPRAAAHAHEGDPVVRAPDHVGPSEREGGGGRGLDVVQERRAVATQHQQGQHPPRAGQGNGEHPPSRQPTTGHRAEPERQQQRGKGQGRHVLDCVDATHEQHRTPGEQGRYPRGQPPVQAVHERQHHPREDGRGQHLRGQHTDQSQEPRGERERQSRDHAPHPVRLREERTEDPARALVGHHQDQRHPQPLDHPVGDTGQLAQQREQTLREEVAVGLVLQLTEGERWVPEVQ